jgi:hypothetical protein
LPANSRTPCGSACKRDPPFKHALLKEAVGCLLAGDIETTKNALRAYIKGTMGFDALAERTRRPERSLRSAVARPESFVVGGDSCAAICCAFSIVVEMPPRAQSLNHLRLEEPDH